MTPDEPRSDALQTGPTPSAPLPPLELPPGLAPVPRSPLWTKLYFLRQAQLLASRAAQRASTLHAFGFLLGLAVGIPLAFIAGVAAYSVVYDNPHRYVDTSRDPSGKDLYFVRGREVTKEEYRYFLSSQDNSTTAGTLAFVTGVVLVVAAVALFWLLFRPQPSKMAQSVEEQIGVIVRDHGEAVASWGGEWVLRVPKLVDKLLDMEAGEEPR
jgi:hypothetical protein